MDTKIAALVILYQFEEQCIHNIETYAKDVDILYAFDNSTTKNKELVNKLKLIDKLHYIDGKGNQGLSKAINRVAKLAIKSGYQWLITFDQDSYALNNIIEQMKEFIGTFPNIDTIGIISPTIKNELIKFTPVKNKISYNEWVIQSGALHNLKAYLDINGYDEKLFIDQVDIEYCVRLTQKGYKIVKLNHAILMHNTQDNDIKIRWLKNGKKVITNKFSPMRYYYFIRNNLYCAKKYKKDKPQYYAQLIRNIEYLIKTLPYEKDKRARLKAIICAYLDYKMGNMGKTNRKF